MSCFPFDKLIFCSLKMIGAGVVEVGVTDAVEMVVGVEFGLVVVGALATHPAPSRLMRARLEKRRDFIKKSV